MCFKIVEILEKEIEKFSTKKFINKMLPQPDHIKPYLYRTSKFKFQN